MRLPFATLSLFTLTLALGSTSAHALAGYTTQMPAAPNSCNTCHTDGGGSPRNIFGEQAGENVTGGAIDWASLCGLDADGDGETNGTELGDPCCTWTSGGDPDSTTTSDPADGEDTSGNECASGDGDGDGDETGGCGSNQVQSGELPAGLAFAFGALALAFIRRRRSA